MGSLATDILVEVVENFAMTFKLGKGSPPNTKCEPTIQTNSMQMKTEMQMYIDKYIKSIVVERHGNKFHGTLIDKEGRTFEFSKDVVDIETFFDNTHKAVYGGNIKETMLLQCFKTMFIKSYAINIKH